jgi:oligopeptide transport system substrate-binding protein
VSPSIFYMGFNMLDPLVGGLEGAARKLRQAISIALDQEEFISIFMNGRGIPAMSPLPPGIFGYARAGGDQPVVYDWVDGPGARKRKPLAASAALLAEAGWPNGRNAKSGEPLVLNLDTTGRRHGREVALDWLTQAVRQARHPAGRSLDRLQPLPGKDPQGRGAALSISAGTPTTRIRRTSSSCSPAARARWRRPGENASNYANPEFDRLFER